MTPGNVIAGSFFAAFVLTLTWLLTCDLREWIEERRWQQDEQRAQERFRLERMGPRLTFTESFDLTEEHDAFVSAFESLFPGLLDDAALDVYDELEDLYALECAEEPRWIA